MEADTWQAFLRGLDQARGPAPPGYDVAVITNCPFCVYPAPGQLGIMISRTAPRLTLFCQVCKAELVAFVLAEDAP